MLKNTILFPLATGLSNLIFVTAVCIQNQTENFIISHTLLFMSVE